MSTECSPTVVESYVSCGLRKDRIDCGLPHASLSVFDVTQSGLLRSELNFIGSSCSVSHCGGPDVGIVFLEVVLE